MPNNIYKQALEVLGESNQLNKTKEECAELIVAISHYEFRKVIDSETVNDIIEEAVDCKLMIRQIEEIFPNKRVWELIERTKLDRLKNLIADRVSRGTLEGK